MADTAALHIMSLVKWVPDAQLERQFDSANRLERAEGILAELDEYPLEAALQIREAHPELDVRVSAVCVGPHGASAALKKALQIGADDAFLLSDEALAGADIRATGVALSAAIRQAYTSTPPGGEEEAQQQRELLVLTGMTSDDGESGAVPAQLAERLEAHLISYATSVAVEDGRLRLSRATGSEQVTLSAPLPAVVSVTDQANDPRYPNFKAIMAAKKKPLIQWSLADVQLDPAEAASRAVITAAEPRPPRSAGEVIDDDGEGGTKIVEFLAKERLL